MIPFVETFLLNTYAEFNKLNEALAHIDANLIKSDGDRIGILRSRCSQKWFYLLESAYNNVNPPTLDNFYNNLLSLLFIFHSAPIMLYNSDCSRHFVDVSRSIKDV